MPDILTIADAQRWRETDTGVRSLGTPDDARAPADAKSGMSLCPAHHHMADRPDSYDTVMPPRRHGSS
jgi:hypothetical protein